MKSRMLAMVVMAASLSGCAFQLGRAYMPYPAGATEADKQAVRDKLKADMADCKQRAHDFEGHEGAAVGSFLLGATIIGYPAGVENEKSVKRQIWSDCMTGRGYRVTKATD